MDFSALLNGAAHSPFSSHLKTNYQDHEKPGLGILRPQGTYRALTEREINKLESQGNICGDWSTIRVCGDFLTEYINFNFFYGTVILGLFNGQPRQLPDGSFFPQSLCFSTLRNSETGNNVVIHRCPDISDQVISDDVIIINSSLTFEKTTERSSSTFGNGKWINIGIETGGRPCPIFADLSLDLAEFICLHPNDPLVKHNTDTYLESWSGKIARSYGIAGDGAFIRGCGLITGSYIGPGAVLDGAQLVKNSTLDSTSLDPIKIGPATVIRNSIAQEGCVIDDGAIVRDSMLFEHSHVSQHGKVLQCIIGPNSGVDKGEATSSFLGPFVGFHHQSLLIAAFWPRGRGNIGYGANVGSNHTSRMPDQECWPAEGMFFGLGCTIKYPANFSLSPYSIVAAGVTTLPQRLSFPFSLIVEPVDYHSQVTRDLQNLIPAWGLRHNFYALKRGEAKFAQRNKAKRNSFELSIFRPEILEMMRNSVKRLEEIVAVKAVYLPPDIQGMGENMMTEENRLKAIETYQFFLNLERYRHDRAQVFNLQKDSSLTLISPQKRIEFADNLICLAEMLPTLILRTEMPVSRDFERGHSIVDDYRETHLPIEEDPFVLRVREEIESELHLTYQAIEIVHNLTK